MIYVLLVAASLNFLPHFLFSFLFHFNSFFFFDFAKRDFFLLKMYLYQKKTISLPLPEDFPNKKHLSLTYRILGNNQFADVTENGEISYEKDFDLKLLIPYFRYLIRVEKRFGYSCRFGGDELVLPPEGFTKVKFCQSGFQWTQKMSPFPLMRNVNKVDFWLTEAKVTEVLKKGARYFDFFHRKSYCFLPSNNTFEDDILFQLSPSDAFISKVIRGKNLIKNYWVEYCPKNERLFIKWRRKKFNW